MLKAGSEPLGIVKATGVRNWFVTKQRKLLGMPPFPKGRKKTGKKLHKNRGEFLKLKQEGKTYREIATINGCSRQYIQQSILYGVKRPKTGKCQHCKLPDQQLSVFYEQFWPVEKFKMVCNPCHGMLVGGMGLKLKGKPVSCQMLGKMADMCRQSIHYRIKQGMTPKQAITIPKESRGRSSSGSFTRVW